MHKHPHHELPFRSKLHMLDDIIQIIVSLHYGDRSRANALLHDLKTRSIFFDEQIQQDVLIFSEHVAFQYDYDPWHKVTPEIQKVADKLINDLGFSI